MFAYPQCDLRLGEDTAKGTDPSLARSRVATITPAREAGAPGSRLGPYEIQSALGAGGMGEVYKATDIRLDRTVAVKVLPEHVATNLEVKHRFEREAKTLAALSLTDVVSWWKCQPRNRFSLRSSSC